ncbi:MAG TPA: cytochrome c, partial [Anaerolineales bacterium]
KEGAAVFNTNCETCHGPQGHGDGPAGQALDPKPRDLALLQTTAGDDFLFWRIREGKPGTSMVAWKGILTDEQIWQAISFIRTLR